MKAKDIAEKEQIRFRFAAALDIALSESNIPSVRQLSINAKMEPAHLQRIYNGEVDLSLVSIISIIEGLEISNSQFFQYFDIISEKDILNFRKKLERQKRKSLK
jgi:hypothetical protein